MHPTRRPGAPRAPAVLLLGALLLPSGEAAALPRPLVRLAAESRVCLVGERHRSPAGHRMFGALVGELATGEGGPLVVGLEIPADRQELLERVAGSGEIPEGLVPPVIDSPSYRRMLAGLGRLAALGRIRLRALDAPEGSGADRDAFMACRVLEALGAGAARVVALVGNLHVLGVPAERLGGRLQAAGVAAARVLTAEPGKGGGAASGRWLPAGTSRVAAAVQQLWSLLRQAPGGAPGAAVHGLVAWPEGPSRSVHNPLGL